MIKYLGGKDRTKVFIKECKDVGLDLRNPDIIKNIAAKPEWFTTIINYSELGLLKRLGSALNEIKENK